MCGFGIQQYAHSAALLQGTVNITHQDVASSLANDDNEEDDHLNDVAFGGAIFFIRVFHLIYHWDCLLSYMYNDTCIINGFFQPSYIFPF